MKYEPTPTDVTREKNMATLFDAIEHTEGQDQKRRLWGQYVKLHETRTAEWIEWEEKRKGLRK